MATDLEAARLMVYNAARMKDAGQTFVKEAAMAKLYSSRAAERITSKALSCTAATAMSKIIRSRNTGATQRSARSMKARLTAVADDREVNTQELIH